MTDSTDSLEEGLTSNFSLAASLLNSGSAAISMNALRRAATRFAGTPGGASTGRATAFCAKKSFMIWRSESLLA